MRKTAIRPVRRKPRKGEPTTEEKTAARAHCCWRANATCERCGKQTRWHQGHLHHEHAKRRFGWLESEHQRHVWLCAACHGLTHSGFKPVPKGEWRNG